MTITNQDVEIYRGDSALLEISLTDANGNPFSLSPSGKVTYRVAGNSHSPETESVIRKDSTNGILIDTGLVSVSLSKTDTDLIPDDYYHELKVYDGADVSTAMTGNFKIRHALQLPKVQQATAAIPVTGNVRGPP